MLPLILAGALLGGAAFAAYQMIKGMRAAQAPGEPGGDGADKSPSIIRRAYDVISGRDALIQRIVDATTFATKRMVVAEHIVGSEEAPSPVPADDISIRPIRGLGELPRVVPSAHVLDEEMFYGLLAANRLPVVEHIERTQLIEREYGKARNVLIVLQDVSGSMGSKDRIPWSLKLNSKLLAKCIKEEAECILVPFSEMPRELHHARTEAECRDLQYRLPAILQAGGGTDIDAALKVALDKLEEERFAEARVVLVTDGTIGITSETHKRLRDLKVFLHTICISVEQDMLRDVSDRYDVLQD